MRRWPAFTVEAPGKWILAGEHSVLRGATAVALPHPEFKLRLKFVPASADRLEIFPPESDREIRSLLDGIVDSWEQNDKSLKLPEGRLEIGSSIPTGAGLGSSAALCVAITRWLSEPLEIQPSQQFEFARGLEHHFHGRSSGMDIAAALAAKPITFSMEKGSTSLPVSQLPKFTFHDTGLRARTSECVFRVKRMHEETPGMAMGIDERMADASRMVMEGLMGFGKGGREVATATIARGMSEAHECFLSWQLVPAEAQRLIEKLQSDGALAAKLTGAGGGGFVVAIWPSGV